MITFSNAIELFIADKRGQRYSEHTLLDYRNTCKRFGKFVGEMTFFEDITLDHIREFFNSTTDVSKKTARNYHSALASLWRWGSEERCFVPENIIHKYPTPIADKPAIAPFAKWEVKQLLEHVGFFGPYKHPRAKSGYSKAVELNPMIVARNKAILLFLLDTGMRVTEFCCLKIHDVHPGDGGVYLAEISNLFAKRGKGRTVPLSTRTWEVTLEYLAHRFDGRQPENVQEPLFVSTESDKPINRDLVRQMLSELGKRAGIAKVHAHRFRHTFAINFLRNGGNVFTLKAILGHSDMNMVERYLEISRTDIERNHVIASPVTNWGL
jgi:integrase/recombinase XerD